MAAGLVCERSCEYTGGLCTRFSCSVPNRCNAMELVADINQSRKELDIERTDGQRLDWIMRNIGGVAAKQLGMWMATGMNRRLIDEAMAKAGK